MRRTRARTRAHARILHELPHDLQLRVADSLEDPRDCARLCLALPPLGQLAMRSLARYQQLILRVGMELVLRGTAIDDALFRRYVRDARATYDGIVWLNAAAAAEGSTWSVRVQPHDKSTNARLADTMQWRLRQGCSLDARLRVENATAVIHFDGAKGDERQVRFESRDGLTVHLEGVKGEERKIKYTHADGSSLHFEGERGEERQVSFQDPDGSVIHYEGERGVERQVRIVLPNGAVTHYEGGQGAERRTRTVHADGSVTRYDFYGEPVGGY